MRVNNKTKILAFSLVSTLGLMSAAYAFASGNTNFSQTISGMLGIDIVDGSGNTVASPSVSFGSIPFSMSTQTTSATLGNATQKIRVTNPTTSATWTASIAATAGPTAVWQGAASSYKFNGSSAQGQMTVNPAVGAIAGVASTATTNVSLGSSSSFAQGTRDSITLMSAATGAQAPGQWDLTGVGISQTIPAAQAADSYSLQMTLTVS